MKPLNPQSQKLATAELYRASDPQAEQRYRELVEGLDAIVWEADPNTWQFTFVSPQAEEILGYPISRWLTDSASCGSSFNVGISASVHLIIILIIP